MVATFFTYHIIPNLSYLPDGSSYRFPVRALGCWT